MRINGRPAVVLVMDLMPWMDGLLAIVILLDSDALDERAAGFRLS